jgi:TetR/AcrR family transcriptional regulator
MPKPTFFNLPASKRDLIVRVAIDEFSQNDYETASISKIVADVGIAKGSFYQYFEDKLDLYQYLLQEGSRMKAEFLAQHPPTAETANPFRYLRWLLKVGLHFEFAHPKLAKIAQKSLSGQGPFPPEWQRQMETESLKFYSGLITQGIANGHLRADLNVEVTAYIFYSVMRDMGAYVLNRLHATPSDSDLVMVMSKRETEVEAIFDQLFTTLEQGMGGPRR